MKQAWKSKSYEIIPGYEIPTLWYEMNTKGYEVCHVVWNKMHRVWTTFGVVWNEKKWYVIIPHMEMRIISYRLYTISYQIWYEFFACFFLMHTHTHTHTLTRYTRTRTRTRTRTTPRLVQRLKIWLKMNSVKFEFQYLQRKMSKI